MVINNNFVFVVVSTAIPNNKKDGNGMGVKINGVYKRASSAEKRASEVRKNNQKIVGGIHCEIQTAVVRCELIEE